MGHYYLVRRTTMRWLKNFIFVSTVIKKSAINSKKAMASKFKLDEVLGVARLPELLLVADQQILKYVNNDRAIGQLVEPLIKAGGKRLRPSLLLACAGVNKNKIEPDAIKLAAVVELVHIGSLIHDDIIDESLVRWSISTINSRDTNQAIVAGDYLLAMACALAAEVSQTSSQLTALTITQLCIGQLLELSDKNNLKRTKANYFKSIDGKTASLISLSCVLGGLMADLNDQELKSLQNFGQNFGLAFQLIDDLLDLVSTGQLYGKPVGNDIGEGVYTLPVLLGIEKQNDINKRLKSDITETLFKAGAMFETMNEIQHYNHLAAEALTTFKDPLVNKIKALPNAYLDWTLRNLVYKPYRQRLLKMQKM
jgi:geranylgeranyl pyrophosphate synthase